jgi:hypothetical protein
MTGVEVVRTWGAAALRPYMTAIAVVGEDGERYGGTEY